MREILFKAKRIKNGEWVEGLLWKKKYNSNNIFISCFPDKDDNEETYVVDPNTICQYTGLTDKNGNKIWENDVVKDNVVFGTVVWDEKHVQFMIDDEFDGHQEYTDWWGEVEVIGNIFDNPELLKGGASNE